MIKSYLYAPNKYFRALRALIPIENTKSVTASDVSSGKFVWREVASDDYQFHSNKFRDDPVQLTNFLVMRERERLAFQAKLFEQGLVKSSGFKLINTKNYTETAY